MSEEGKVKIGCRLPFGYTMRWRGDIVRLQGPDGNTRVSEPGFQTVADLGVGIVAPHKNYGETEVDSNFWFNWRLENDGRNELKNGQIFEIV